MNQETNDFLEQNLIEAHAIFNNIISEMQQIDISFEYEFVKQKEKNSFYLVKSLLLKMKSNLFEYSNLREDNIDVFNQKDSIYLKYFSLYIVSIVFIKLYHEIFNTGKFDEFFHYIVGLFLGSTFVGLLNKDLNEIKYGNKENRDLINKLQTLKEEYKKSHDIVVNEIDQIFALNDNLWEVLDKGKKLVKNK